MHISTEPGILPDMDISLTPVSSAAVNRPSPFPNYSTLEDGNHRAAIDGGYTSSSDPNYPDTSEPHPRFHERSAFRNRIAPPGSDRRPPRPAQPLRPARAPPIAPLFNVASPLPEQTPPLKIHKIELVRRKRSLPPAAERTSALQSITDVTRSLTSSVQRKVPTQAYTRWTAAKQPHLDSSTFNMISPKSHTRQPFKQEIKRRSFHEPELKSAIDRLETLMQEAGNLATEAADQGRPDELSNVVEAQAVFRNGYSKEGTRNSTFPRQHTPLRFRVTNTSSDSSSSSSTSSSSFTSATVIRHRKQQPRHGVVELHTNRRQPPEAEMAHVHNVDRPHSRGRTPLRDIRYGDSHPRPKSSSSGRQQADCQPVDKHTRSPHHKVHNRVTCAFDNDHQKEGTHRDQLPHPIIPETILRLQRRNTDLDSPPLPWSRRNTIALPLDAGGPGARSGKYNKDEDRGRKHKPHKDSYLTSREYHIDVENPRPWHTKTEITGRKSRSELLHFKKDPIARRWPHFRKRFTATTVCVNTALIGFIIGVYVWKPRLPFFLPC
jgi:hypothetical protein